MEWSNIKDCIEWCEKNLSSPRKGDVIDSIKIKNMGTMGFEAIVAFAVPDKLLRLPVLVQRVRVNAYGDIIHRDEAKV